MTTVFVTHDQAEAMDVADEIVLMNKARIEQVAAPRELYEQPANEFVMAFVGESVRLGDSWVRPHDIALSLDAEDGAVEALVERVVHLGSEVRAELALADGERIQAQVTPDEAELLELLSGQILFVRARRVAADFSADPTPPVPA